MDVATAIKAQPQLAIFSAGAQVSLEVAPLFAQAGTTVIDNSSAWRMQTNIPLIIPEINAHTLTKKDTIIANPNCSTIQMLMVLAPLGASYYFHLSVCNRNRCKSRKANECGTQQ